MIRTTALFLCLMVASSISCGDETVRPDGAGGWVIHNSDGTTDSLDSSGGGSGMRYRNAGEIMQQMDLRDEQIKNQELQNELLRLRIEREKRQLEKQDAQTQTAPQANPSATWFQQWAAENKWFGRDKEATDFAMQYATQLREQRPDLVGRPFMDAVTAKVKVRFHNLDQ